MTRDELKQAVIKWVKAELAGSDAEVRAAVIQVLDSLKKCLTDCDVEFQSSRFSTPAKQQQFRVFAQHYSEIKEAEAKAEYEAGLALPDRYRDDDDYFQSAEYAAIERRTIKRRAR